MSTQFILVQISITDACVACWTSFQRFQKSCGRATAPPSATRDRTRRARLPTDMTKDRSRSVHRRKHVAEQPQTTTAGTTAPLEHNMLESLDPRGDLFAEKSRPTL